MFNLEVVMRFKFVTLYIVLLVLCSWFCLFCLCLSLYFPGNAWGNPDKESPLATGSGKHVSGIYCCALPSLLFNWLPMFVGLLVISFFNFGKTTLHPFVGWMWDIGNTMWDNPTSFQFHFRSYIWNIKTKIVERQQLHRCSSIHLPHQPPYA